MCVAVDVGVGIGVVNPEMVRHTVATVFVDVCVLGLVVSVVVLREAAVQDCCLLLQMTADCTVRPFDVNASDVN